MHKNIKKQKINFKKGFTLVELLITITMFVIVTGVVLVNSNSFDSSVLLNNFAYDVALTIKQAQSYGVNVRETSNFRDVGLNQFNSAYGVFFDLTQSNTNFVLFNDAPATDGTYNRIYDSSITTCSVDDPECIQKYTIRKGNIIKSICAGSGPDDCPDGVSKVEKLSILFQRPNLAALIYSETSGILSSAQPYAKVTLSAESGATQAVVVTSVGQIYVKK
ncbi:MAG: type II secretion system protein [Candidatus Paceibacterota bacterium]|jgi:prepilin-type N-terminal cleavage/methylation domain-containing protein